MDWSDILDNLVQTRRRSSLIGAAAVRLLLLLAVWLMMIIPRTPGWVVAGHWLFTVTFVLFAFAYGVVLYCLIKDYGVGKTSLLVSILDVLAISLLVLFAGGLQSPFIVLYVFLLAGTTVFGDLRQALIVALGGFILFALVVLLVRFSPLFQFDVLTGGGKVAGHALQMKTFLVLLAVFVLGSLIANVYLNRRLRDYHLLLNEREERIRAANLELTRSFYDLEEMTDSVRASSDRQETSQKMLLASQRSATAGYLAAGLVHDMADPLTVIANEAEMGIVRQDDTNDKVRERFQRVYAAANYLIKLSENLRILTKQEDNPLYGSVDMNRLIRRCMTILDPHRRQRGLVFNSHFSQPVQIVSGIESQLEQVVINLLINAIQAMPTRGGHVNVRSWIERDELAVEVEDDGEGISPDNLKKVFAPFFTTRVKDAAIGLGLYTAKTIIVNHGGQITVRSEPGVSTVLTLKLPVNV